MKRGQKVTFTDEQGETRRGYVTGEHRTLVGDEERVRSVNVRTEDGDWAVSPGHLD